jgi:hypothetical protein
MGMGNLIAPLAYDDLLMVIISGKEFLMVLISGETTQMALLLLRIYLYSWSSFLERIYSFPVRISSETSCQ